MRTFTLLLVILLTLIGVILPGQAQQQPPLKPMILPMASEPGPSTWLLGQPYGNTTSAYNFGDAWYSAGQGLHFGLDFSMPCGTPLVAMADGYVEAVDALSFGSAPHNLIIDHPDLGIATLYGHLLERPLLVAGEFVQQGDVVALSGEPRGNCEDRPHLHLEVRSLDYRTTYNPVNYIEADWHTLMLMGPYANPIFQQDLTNPRRWMSIDDQPSVQFGGRRLNDYVLTTPLDLDIRPPINPPPLRQFDPLPADTDWRLQQVAFSGCCARAWWHPARSDRFYAVDGVAGQVASVFEFGLDGSNPTYRYPAPAPLLSPDGSLQVEASGQQITIRHVNTDAAWTVITGGVIPSISPDNSKILWEIWDGTYVPGEAAQRVMTWVSDITGENPRLVWQQSGGWSAWIDPDRLLIVTPGEYSADTTLTIYDTRDGSSFSPGTWDYLRGLSIAPGGQRLMFYLTFQADPAQNGIYTIETLPGATAQQLPFFGDWRWRDADSVYYIPYDPPMQAHQLAYYHIPDGTSQLLIDPSVQPFKIANGDWSVAPDGNGILFLNALDGNTWLLQRQD